MEVVLKHAYLPFWPDVSTDMKRLFKIIYAAEKYNLDALKAWCNGLLIRRHHHIYERIAQLEMTHRHSLDQLKAVCVARLSVDMSVLENKAVLEKIPYDLLAEIIQASNKRKNETKEIVAADMTPVQVVFNNGRAFLMGPARSA